MKKLFTVVLVVFTQFCFGQSAIIRINTEEITTEVFDNLIFNINGVELKATDLDPKKIALKKGLDKIVYYTKDNEKNKHEAYCKFLPGESYTIFPCVCCGDFLIIPDSVPRRGSVRFINKSNRTVWGLRSELDYDTIPSKTTTAYLPSYISMNCGFRPLDLQVVEKEFFDVKFDNISIVDRKQSNSEREKHVTTIPFVFLHGEKVTLTYSNNKKLKIKLEGYLTDKEYKANFY